MQLQTSNEGKETTVINKQVVQQNVAQWRKQRRQRDEAIVRRENSKRLDEMFSVGATAHWEGK